MWWIAIAIPAVVLTILGVLLWIGAREHRKAGSELAALRALSEIDAKRLALELLERQDMFHSRKAMHPVDNSGLPDHVVDLLSRYDEVEYGEFWIGTAALSQPACLPGYIKIGEDSEFTEILVRPGDRRIFVSYGEGPRSSSTLETEPTVWHEIIVASGIKPPAV